jgi:hypothetical protein
MEEHDEYAKNRLALSAMRQALGFLHRDDAYFDRITAAATAAPATPAVVPNF